ncbi:putative NAD(P)-binding domain-containing protein [Seiridium cardinale]
MVSLKVVQQSNAQVANLPRGLVALFIGATSGIGESALQHFAQHAPAPRIYTVARPSTAASHEKLISSLRVSKPEGTYKLITADVSLVAEIDKVVKAVVDKETKIDFLVMSAGFMAFEGRKDTREGLDPSMSTRYYSRLRAVEQVLPLLNSTAVASPRIVSVLAGGREASINESDLDLRDRTNWSFWNASVHSATMGTLALEQIARENPRLSIVHWYPGPVATPGLERAQKHGMNIPDPMSQGESGARALFLATSDRCAVRRGLIAVPEGVETAEKTRGGIFLVDPLGETIDNEVVLTDMRERGVGEAVWNFTQKVFAASVAQSDERRDEL